MRAVNSTLVYALFLLGVPVCASEVTIALPAGSAQVAFAVAKLEAGLRASGDVPEYRRGASSPAGIEVRFPENVVNAAPGGFVIRKIGAKRIAVLAPDESGAMYGTLQMAEQIRSVGLKRVQEQQVNPRFPFRAIKAACGA